MRAKTTYRLVLVLGLVLIPVIGILLFAGAATYDGGIVGSALLVIVPFALYGIGFALVLRGLTKRMTEEQSITA